VDHDDRSDRGRGPDRAQRAAGRSGVAGRLGARWRGAPAGRRSAPGPGRAGVSRAGGRGSAASRSRRS
jgi:hypothetical protein